MKYCFASAMAIVVLFASISCYADAHQPETEILFTQSDKPQDRILKELNDAKSSIVIQEYQLTAQPVIEALVAAQKRGVKVSAVLDHSLGYPLHDGPKVLHESGCTVYFDCSHAIAHNKLAIIDDKLAIGGSYNWSDGAEKHNAENLDVFHNPAFIALIAAQIERHKAHSKTYAEMAKYVAEKEHVEKTK